MFGDNIEQLVLSGALFNGGERSNSPTRSPSPDAAAAQWPPDSPSTYNDKKLFGESDNESDTEPSGPPLPAGAPQEVPQESIGMGPGRTGVKGVIRDADEHRQRERAKASQQLKEHNEKLEARALTARTFFEDEAAAGRTEKPGRRTERYGRFGHLREVGQNQFVQAVEGEARGTWVVVHIYEESLDRCAHLDSVLVDLARRHPQTKFLRARAAALGFASKPSAKPARPTTRSRLAPSSFRDGEEEEEDASSDKDGERSDEEDDVDTDMLPTLLAYLDGDLVHNWVRVDWDVKIDDVEELLSKHHIVSTVDRALVEEDD
ncbi:thioredoxin-like protein [Auriculariales sp. MPI-PUGE-AT-0066]|nr:thioredoxin-like protein [Auriculariales sp. MPI-PUGE-AT-0066]